MGREARPDLPLRLLAAAVRWLPPGRESWGAAMVAELAYVEGSFARWRFTLGCAGVALIHPPEVHAMANNGSGKVTASFTRAGLIGLLAIAPFAILELWNAPMLRRPLDVAALFSLLWMLPTACVMIAMPLVRAVRSGSGILHRPYVLGLRVIALLFVASVWVVIVGDQLPCFLGAPNCD